MADNLYSGFPMPSSSWEMIKRIVNAYYANHDAAEPTVKQIAELAGIKRPVVSANNNFLRVVGVLESEQNKLTELGMRLAIGLDKKNEPMVTESLQTIVSKTERLNQLAKMLLARGSMSQDQFRIEIMLALGISEKSRQAGYIKTLVDLLVDSKVLQAVDNKLAFHGYHVSEIKGSASELGKENSRELPPASKPPTPPSEDYVPIALGFARRAYIKLPSDWQAKKDLPKLLKMIELALGDEENSAQA